MTLKLLVIFLALCVPFLAATIWALTDVAQKEFGTTGKKALWWVIASVPFIGAMFYLIFGFRKGKKLQDSISSLK
ncbi:MAG: PLDc N-terminal domain-containing protein [Desulfobacterales bacterium]|nr:MAG: PLDc N-terminal domain-containing protein [Desulfobacterales bacterium]